MWANAQRDGRPAEYRRRPLFNAAVWLTPTTRVLCSNAAKTRNPLKLPGVPQTNETISTASWPKFTILRHSSSGRQPNCGVEQRAPPIFGRAPITLGIGPHFYF